jgi:ornithine cyclodeaminase
MSAKAPILWIAEADVVAHVPLNDAIDALERGFALLGRQDAFNVPKALGTFGDGSSMHSLGAGSVKAGHVGFKNWVFTKRGATALYVMFNAVDGSIAAVIEAAALGQLRTSAISGLATRWMAPATADTLALIGTGAQALTQAIAVALVRNLREVRVFGRDPEKRDAFVERLARELPTRVVAATSVEAATAGAGIVTLVTRAEEPFLTSAMLAQGAHVNAVGAILPRNAEFHQDVFDRCSMLAVDDVAGARANSREFRTRFGTDAPWVSVTTLGALIAEEWRRPEGADVTLFKALGMGVSDLAVATLVLERTQGSAERRTIPHPLRAALRWELPTKPAASVAGSR